MEDYINGDWLDTISISFNKTIAKNAGSIIKKCEPEIRNFGHQWYANFAGYKVILLKPGEGYEWHFDNMNYINGELSCPALVVTGVKLFIYQMDNLFKWVIGTLKAQEWSKQNLAHQNQLKY